MENDIPKAYDAKKAEDGIYKRWEESGFFNPDNLPGKRKKSFYIPMPPPNATGVLHAGHAVMLSIQDIATRFQRMRGKLALWLPGTDHAAIATQAVVEKIIAKEGKTRQGMGREKFLERVDEFIKNSQDTIHVQMRRMGASCDWSREHYTLDEGLSHAVSEAFVRMYNDGLIYRGHRIVNWCPRCGSTLADDEVEYKTQKAKLFYIKYGRFTIATTRPETKVGDTALAVNPDDLRYKDYIGKEYDIELASIKIHIKVIADIAIDPGFGTGALGVTPAHSLIDYEMAKNYNLPIIQVIGQDGKMTQSAGVYAGMDVKSAREKFVEDLTKASLIEKIEEVENNLSVCYRCGTAIEPMPSEQWFVDVNKKLRITNYGLRIPQKEASLKEMALYVVRSKQIKIIPERFEKIYFNWMENLHDWCISRQIWFGHRIPVWYKEKEIYVGAEPPKGEGWKQDPDTLDTWFSSGLWTFSTLGWPEKTKDLKTYHPATLMETAYDILFFWVARMIIMSNYLMKEAPFETVYIHGLIKDKNGQKMSKSKPETTIDPVGMIEKYGADAMRLALVIGNTPGNDSRLYEEKIAGFRNFTNKLWNISRFIFTSVEKIQLVLEAPAPKTFSDKYILKTFENIKSIVTQDLEEYRFSQAGEVLREFTWGEFADWYIEIAKIRSTKSEIRNKTQNPKPKTFSSPLVGEDGRGGLETEKQEILLYILEQLLILWHPFMPFVTEEIWKNFQTDELLMMRQWPKVNNTLHNQSKSIVNDFTQIQKIIIATRNLKAENGLASRHDVPIAFYAKKSSLKALHLDEMKAIIERLAGVKIELVTQYSKKRPKQSAFTVVGVVEIYLSITGIIDVDAKQKEIADKEAYIKTLEQKLSNKEFTTKAPKQIIEKEKQKLLLQKDELHKLKGSINNLI